MKSKFVKCTSCSSEITSDKCELATYSTVIDGKEYTFCCKNCAKDYKPDSTNWFFSFFCLM